MPSANSNTACPTANALTRGQRKALTMMAATEGGTALCAGTGPTGNRAVNRKVAHALRDAGLISWPTMEERYAGARSEWTLTARGWGLVRKGETCDGSATTYANEPTVICTVQ